MTDKLKPCPFCGGNNLGYKNIYGGYTHEFKVFCRKCGSEGSAKGTKRAAKNVWNRRADNDR